MNFPEIFSFVRKQNRIDLAIALRALADWIETDDTSIPTAGYILSAIGKDIILKDIKDRQIRETARLLYNVMLHLNSHD